MTLFQIAILKVFKDAHDNSRTGGDFIEMRWLYATHVAHKLWPKSKAWKRVSNCGNHGGAARGIMMGAKMAVHIRKLVKSGHLRERDPYECLTKLRPEFAISIEGMKALRDHNDQTKCCHRC